MGQPRRRPSDWFRSFALAVPVVAVVAGAGCGSSIFDTDVNLQRQVYRADFGTAQGTIPSVACNPAGPDVCGASAGSVPAESGATTADVRLACDGTLLRCFAQARVVWSAPVDVLQDDDFITKVERRAIVVVRQVDLAYTVPTNTLTFDVPAIHVFVGPSGATSETDTGVVAVGDTEPLAAGLVVDASSARHLVVADGTAAHGFIETQIRNKQTLVFIVVLAPRVDAGAPVPAGAFEVDMVPRLTLGLPD